MALSPCQPIARVRDAQYFDGVVLMSTLAVDTGLHDSGPWATGRAMCVPMAAWLDNFVVRASQSSANSFNSPTNKRQGALTAAMGRMLQRTC